MIHTMPDKTVRVTSRYPKGHGTVYFDLAKAHGFTLEADRYNSDTLVLKAVGCYNDYTAHYGDPAEAEADLADLSLMLADRHTLPAASSVPALASMQPCIALGPAGRRGWGWKGTTAGLALGALGAVAANHALGTNGAADRPALQVAGIPRLLPHNDKAFQGAEGPAVPSTDRMAGPAPSTAQQPAPPAALAAAPRPQPRAAAPNFGLQP